MSTLLLRTLTRKSLIGFGNFKDLTVQNLIDLLKHKELLNIYYTCRNIDFSEDIIKELKIDEVCRINKKEKQDNRYVKDSNLYIKKCLYFIIEENKLLKVKKMHLSQLENKTKKISINKNENRLQRKEYLRSKNQWQ